MSAKLNEVYSMDEIIEKIILRFPDLMRATGITMMLAFAAVLVGVGFGLVLALARISRNRIIRSVSWVYIWLFRGTPMLLQIFFIYFILPQIAPALRLSEFPAAIVALGLNSAAYLAEIIRGAIQSIDKGQLEASKALGMSYGLTMRRIVIPQSIRRMIPPFGNEFIMLLKDTSLVSAIGISELMRLARQASSGGESWFYLPIAAIYLSLTSLFTYIFDKLEKKYSIYE
jgi:polar amino acid transport system permease protein